MSRALAATIWAILVVAVPIPMFLAVASPQLAWRNPVYIVAGVAGVFAMTLLLIQPLLAGAFLPGLSPNRGRHIHRAIGYLLVLAVVIHVAGLWITSPPDVVDALLFVSPTPFSAWGVVAMWAVLGTALLAVFRKGLRLRTWRLGHRMFALVIVVGSVIHAMLIEGTMETASKAVLCFLVLTATIKTIAGPGLGLVITKAKQKLYQIFRFSRR
jgi:predicted ferric reductase